MKIPKQLKIGGHIYKVILHDRMEKGGSDKLGTSYVYKNRIFLDNKVSPSQLESTLLHEILEVINSLNNIGATEEKICQFETGLYQVLKDNKLLK